MIYLNPFPWTIFPLLYNRHSAARLSLVVICRPRASFMTMPLLCSVCLLMIVSNTAALRRTRAPQHTPAVTRKMLLNKKTALIAVLYKKKIPIVSRLKCVGPLLYKSYGHHGNSIIAVFSFNHSTGTTVIPAWLILIHWLGWRSLTLRQRHSRLKSLETI